MHKSAVKTANPSKPKPRPPRPPAPPPVPMNPRSERSTPPMTSAIQPVKNGKLYLNLTSDDTSGHRVMA
jgi:hypothetical protein